MRAPIFTSEQSKALDRFVSETFDISDRTMIEVAGRSIATFSIDKNFIDVEDRILVCVGSGHNGCDGLVVARHLKQLGLAVDILLCCNELKSEISKQLLEIDKKIGISVYNLTIISDPAFFNPYTLIFDAITGTGFHGAVRPEHVHLIEKIENRRATGDLKVISIDVPSFNDVDLSSMATGMSADITLALQTLKKIHVEPPQIENVGDVYLLDIGLPLQNDFKVPDLFTTAHASEVAAPIFSENPLFHKGNKAKVVVFGGNEGKEGAAFLSALASLRAGASLATVCSRSKSRFNLQIPEIMYEQLDSSQDAKIEELILHSTSVVLGPGLGTDDIAFEIFLKVLECSKKHNKLLVVDADALQLMATANKSSLLFPSNTVLSPHPKEFLAIAKYADIEITGVQEVLDNRYELINMLTLKMECTIVLKGARSLIFNQNRGFVNPHAVSSLAVGGSGDVLSGIIASIVSRGSNTLELTALAVFLHGEAGLSLSNRRSTPFGNLASDIAHELPNEISKLLSLKRKTSHWIKPYN